MVEKSRVLELALGGLYLMAGLSKLLPIQSMVDEFDKLSVHFPFGLHPPGWLFLRSVGVVEAVGGYFLITECSKLAKSIATMSLMGIMVGAVNTLYAVGEPPVMFMPACFCFLGLAYLLASKYTGGKSKPE